MELRLPSVFVLLVGLLAVSSHVCAEVLPSPLSTLMDDSAEQDIVHAARTKAYREIMAQYAHAIAAQPRNVDLVLAHCRFIARFIDDEYGDWVESAPQDHDACVSTLRVDWADQPEAQLYDFEQSWSEESLKQGEALLARAEQWPDEQRKALLTALAQRYDSYKKRARASELALAAVRLGDGEHVPLAIERLVELNDQAGAAALLRDTPAADGSWQADQRLRAALKIDDPSVALTELLRYQDGEIDVAATIAARIHLRASDSAAAHAALHDATDSSEDGRQVRFDTALAVGDMALAIAQIEIADTDHMGANLQRFALLMGRWPQAVFTGALAIQVVWVGLIAMMLTLLPGLLLVPVHYRGVLRRLSGQAPAVLFNPVGLRHAWVALWLVLCTPILVASVLEPDLLATLFDGNSAFESAPLLRVALWGAVVNLVLVLPLTIRLGRMGALIHKPLWRQFSWVPLAWVAVYLVSFLQGIWLQHYAVDTQTVQAQFVDKLINSGSGSIGMLVSFFVVALLVPIVEELLFRGLMLGGMARHISFGWSNFLQALCFALVHDDSPHFVVYLTLGLLAGALVGKTRSLAPAMALHILNNALAFVLMHR